MNGWILWVLCVHVCVYIQKMELPTIPPFALIKGQHSRHQLWSSSLRPIYVTNKVIPYNTLPPAQHHSFFNFKLNPFIYNQLKCIYAKKMQFNWKSQSCCFDAFLFLSREPCAVNTKSHHWFGQHAYQHINNFWWGMNEVIILLSIDDPFDICSYSKQKIYLLLMLW